MRREEMAGENLRDGVVEVAFEQRTEQHAPSRLRRVLTLQGNDIGRTCIDGVQKFFSEIRWYHGYKIRPKHESLGRFYMP